MEGFSGLGGFGVQPRNNGEISRRIFFPRRARPLRGEASEGPAERDAKKKPAASLKRPSGAMEEEAA